MLSPGDAIDIWVVQEVLGRGGGGSVYRCANREARRIEAAVKVLDDGLRRSEHAQKRFVREAEVLFRLDHPNVVRMRSVRVDTDPPYLEMELVRGTPLVDIIARGPIPYAEALRLVDQLAHAVRYLHEAGVCHRDIKPGNLIVQDDGVLRLVDFGLALEAHASRITRAGTVFGTVAYAPPEWLEPERLDPILWDLYSVGVVFHELLTGHLAFEAPVSGSPRQRALQVMAAKRSVESLDPGPAYRADVRGLIRHLTHREPEKRFGDAALLVSALDGLVPSLDPAGPGPEHRGARFAAAPSTVDFLATMPDDTLEQEPSPSDQPALRIGPTRRRRSAWPFALAASSAVVAGAAWMLWPRSATPRPVEVVVTGVPAALGVAVALDGERLEGVDFAFTHAGLPPGEHVVTWAVGRGCSEPECPGRSCPSWCAQGAEPRSWGAGAGPARAVLALQPPEPRTVRLRLPELPSETPRAAALTAGGRTLPPRSVGDALHFPLVAPGPWTLRISAGTCAADAAPCWPDGTCPAGCTVTERALEVAAEPGALELSVDLPAPEPSAQPAPAPRRVASPRSRAAFAAFLDRSPAWHRDATVAARRADPRYLSGWSGAEPPPGTAAAPVVHVSWLAAQAFCAPRGGLAGLDDPPEQWTEGPDQPWQEWRQLDGGPALRSGDGERLTQVSEVQTSPGIGLRCRR